MRPNGWRRPDVNYTFTTVGADAAAKATSTIDIVVGPAGERTTALGLTIPQTLLLRAEEVIQ